jgi:transposase
MLRMTPSCPVYLAVGATDMRNNIDGLLLKIKFQFKLDPFENALFVFCNRSRNKLKILFWDKNGFWLYYRRLDSGTFQWPQKSEGRKTLPVTEQQLSWLLDGLNIEESRAHKEVFARKII